MVKPSRLPAHGGFTLIEALVALFVGTIALLGLYGLVDASNKLTKEQTEVADVQQSARNGLAELSRIVRQSRVGGLYFGNAVLPIANNGVLLTNADVVSYGGLPMTDLAGVAHSIRPGTDVIEVRGVIFGDKYTLDNGDVTCNPSCGSPGAQITVTIPATASLGHVNFPLNGAPSLASKTRPFYFSVLDGENQQVTVSGLTYLVPIYAAGLVDTTGSWFTQTASTFTFTMTQDDGARKLDATTTLPPSLTKSLSGGAVDIVRFFADDTGNTHPSLAEAAWDPQTGQWDIQTLIENVEDFQIAYGVDGAPCPANPACYDGGVSPVAVDAGAVNGDEWVGNVPTEVETTLNISAPDANHSGVDAFINTAVASGRPAAPALHSVWISLVVKAADPDLVFDGPGARGIKILDSTASSFSATTGRPYRRRSLSLAVSLRNNGGLQ
jgi:type II secretory pathway pseudopilin PulG